MAGKTKRRTWSVHTATNMSDSAEKRCIGKIPAIVATLLGIVDEPIRVEKTDEDTVLITYRDEPMHVFETIPVERAVLFVQKKLNGEIVSIEVIGYRRLCNEQLFEIEMI